MRGTVDRLAPEGGFGFIIGENGQEFFFHRTALQAVEFEELAPGSPVVFEAGHQEDGDRPEEHVRAVNIHLADDALPAEDYISRPPEKAA
jgi:cold shock CspA family protein